MSIHNLDKVFKPRSIALVGASQEPGSPGLAIMKNLVQSGFSGEILPVNPACRNVLDRDYRRSLKELEHPVDLVVTTGPLAALPGLVADCLALGAGGCVSISAAGRKAGGNGREVETALRKMVKDTGFRIIGPGSVGIMENRHKLNAGFAPRLPLPGKTAFVSQSGALMAAILDLSLERRIGFSHFISLGGMIDVNFGDMIDYLGGDPEVKSILLYVEDLAEGRGFMSAARAVSRVKPVIALRAGRSGGEALPASGGVRVEADAVYEAAFRRAGILRVKTFEELFDCAEILAKNPRLQGASLAIITNAEGPAIMAADALIDYGLRPAALDLATVMRLDAVLPPGWNRANPVNLQHDATPERFRLAVETCLHAPEIDGILIIMAPYPLADPARVASGLTEIPGVQARPVFTVWMGGPAMEKGRHAFRKAGIPTFDTPERAVRAFVDLHRYGLNQEMLQQVPAKLPFRLQYDCRRARGILDAKGVQAHGSRRLEDAEVKEMLAAYGIAVKPAAAAEAAGAESPPAADRRGVEFMAGICRTPGFGPVILFGPGGGMTGIYPDQGIALPPLNRLLARRLMEETRIHRLLGEDGGGPAATIPELEEALIRISQLAVDFPEIECLEINPLKVSGAGVLAAGARAVVGPAAAISPFHLVISPYPNQYECRVTTGGGADILVRPVRPEDALLFDAFFKTLSPRSIYNRFFGSFKHIPPRMLARFTQIDYDREVALVAIQEDEGGESMLGIARIIFGLGRREAEFAVMVGDRWHGRGIGAALLKRSLMIAKGLGIETVWAIVLAENTQMLRLGRKLGFKVERVESDYELTIDLRDARIPSGPDGDWNLIDKLPPRTAGGQAPAERAGHDA